MYSSDTMKQSNSNCEHYLKIGCNNNNNQELLNDYSIFKKCQFSFKSSSHPSRYMHKKDLEESLPITESESNRMCLAYWPIYKVKQNEDLDNEMLNYITPFTDYFINENNNNNEINNKNNDDDELDIAYIVLSKSTNSETFSIQCSVWESFKNSKQLKITDDISQTLCEKNMNNQIFNRKNSQKNNIETLISNSEIVYTASASASALIIDESDRESDNSFIFDYKGTCYLNSKATRLNQTGFLLFYFIFNLNFLK